MIILNREQIFVNFVKFTTEVSLHAPLAIECVDKFIEEAISTNFLGIQIDNHLNWKNCVDQILPKLGAACFAVRKLFHTLNIDILVIVSFAYFHSIMKYGIIWGNSTYICHVFTLQKRIIRIMSGVGAKSSCRNLDFRLPP
jgi:hypothetical protein